ncbi:hypothetical protein BC827DRAFT_517757 [Russula dissimulans]|nr:hypothetical protein BC827DRAFT_517757 [Russula dissimulans]
MVPSGLPQDAHNLVRARSFPTEIARGRDAEVASTTTIYSTTTTTASSSPEFPEPVAPASHLSDRPSGHHRTQASSGGHQPRRTRDVQADADGSIQSDDLGSDGGDNMRMQSPVTLPPVIPSGTPMPMQMPNPDLPGLIPINLGTPRIPRLASVPLPSQTMQVTMAPSPPSGPVPMAGPGPMPMPMPAPAVAGGGLSQTPMSMPALGGVLVTGATAMAMSSSPSVGAGTVPQVLKFDGYGQYSAGLLYHSPHSVVYQPGGAVSDRVAFVSRRASSSIIGQTSRRIGSDQVVRARRGGYHDQRGTGRLYAARLG